MFLTHQKCRSVFCTNGLINITRHLEKWFNITIFADDDGAFLSPSSSNLEHLNYVPNSKFDYSDSYDNLNYGDRDARVCEMTNHTEVSNYGMKMIRIIVMGLYKYQW